MTDSIDMRSLSPAARHARRVEVIALRKAGGTYDVIAERLGLSRTGVFDICKRHDTMGMIGLHDQASGRMTGDGRALDPDQERQVRQTITDLTPDQLKMSSALWTREAVGVLIEQRFAIRLPMRTIGVYLARWGLVARKKAAGGGEPASAVQWLARNHPVISLRASMEDAEIHWIYTGRLRGRDGREGCWPSPPGSIAPRMQEKVSHEYLISAVTNRGQMRWKVYSGAPTPGSLIDFLRRLVRATARRVFVVLQGTCIEFDDTVRDWLAEHVDEIEVFLHPEACRLQVGHDSRLVPAAIESAG